MGSKTLYQNHNTITAAPKGYVAVFINHVGRHGARHLTSDVASSAIAQMLSKADSAGGLSEKGKELREKIGRLAKIEKPNIKSISQEGKEEQQELAKRMYNNYTNVFDQSIPSIHIAYTKEIRTLQTSDAFMAALLTKIKTPVLEKRINDTTLRFYDLSPAYLQYKKNGNWTKLLDELKTSLHYQQLTATITDLFFTREWHSTMTKADEDEFVSGLFGYVCILPSVQNEMTAAGYTKADLDMVHYFNCDQLDQLSKIDNAEDFLLKGPASDNNGIQVKIAAPLLADFISTTDDYIKNKSTPLQLRFSHAETIAPFAALLSLTTASQTENNLTNIENKWDAGKIIPLSSNIQWVLYKSKNSNNYLVKILLNEKETGITGLPTTTFPYYKYEVVRDFYLKKLKSLQLNPETNYLQYLQELK